jgi:NTE family protein
MSQSSPHLGLALGGGSVLGLAHVGALQALVENSIQPDILSGTSAGALAATLYAFDVPVETIMEEAYSLDWLRLAQPTLSARGLLTNERIESIIRKYVGDRKIEDASVPLLITATDISRGVPVVLDHGDVALAVRASCSIPGVFRPVEIEGRLLVDGGVTDNVPIRPLLDRHAAHIVAIDVLSHRYRPNANPQNIFDVLNNTYFIMIQRAMRTHADQAEVLIEPDLSHFSSADFRKHRDIVQAGYEETNKHMDQIRALSVRKQPWWRQWSI